MHELFTTAAVQHAQVGETLKILQGLCGMTPVRQLERRLIFEGPKGPPLVPIGSAFLQSRQQANTSVWKELNEQLLRQSYYLSISYELDATRFGKSTSNEQGASTGEVQ
jgi:mediator of RNA polymerase II transcription subunit 18, fungi type